MEIIILINNDKITALSCRMCFFQMIWHVKIESRNDFTGSSEKGEKALST